MLVSADDVPAIREQLAAHLLTPSSAFPLPSSPLQDVERIEAVVFPDSAAFKVVSNACQKENKSIKAREAAAERARALEDARRAVQDGKSVFVSVDVEVYERNHDIVLELGWSYFDQYQPPPNPHPQDEKNSNSFVPKSSRDRRLVSRHYCNEEHRHTRNGQFCADQKMSFDFGASGWGTVQDAVNHFKRDLESIEHLVLVGHNLDADVKFLANMGATFPNDTRTIDTGHVDMALRNANQPVSLGKLLDRLGIEYWALHNAGNDARYTLEAFLMMAGVELDFQSG